MIVLLSPAKTLDYETPVKTALQSDLLFPDKAGYLAKKLARMSPGKLRKMMDISEDLAQLNADRYARWDLSRIDEDGRQAVLAFKGDVYQGLAAENFTDKVLERAQERLRILSGLYGVLRPLDLMLPYRLEMGTSWEITPKTKSLYAFWKKEVTARLTQDLKAFDTNIILNLASVEYAKAADFKKTGAKVIAPKFKEERGGRFQMISFFAKKARGLMAAFVLENEVHSPEGLKNFDREGYAFNERLSDINKDEWVFTRKST